MSMERDEKKMKKILNIIITVTSIALIAILMNNLPADNPKQSGESSSLYHENNNKNADKENSDVVNKSKKFGIKIETSSIDHLIQKPNNSNNIILAMLMFSLLIILVLIYMLVSLYKWRIKLNDSSEVMILPEVHFNILEVIEEKLNKNEYILNKIILDSDNNANSLSNRINEIVKTFETLKNNLDKNDREISRLREGYDNSIKKHFALSILNLKDRVDYYFQADGSSDELKVICINITKIIEIYLNENDVIEFSPEKGSNIRDAEGVDVSESIPTKKQDEVGQIVDVIKPGYMLHGLDGNSVIIRNATIKVYIGD